MFDGIDKVVDVVLRILFLFKKVKENSTMSNEDVENVLQKVDVKEANRSVVVKVVHAVTVVAIRVENIEKVKHSNFRSRLTDIIDQNSCLNEKINSKKHISREALFHEAKGLVGNVGNKVVNENTKVDIRVVVV